MKTDEEKIALIKGALSDYKKNRMSHLTFYLIVDTIVYDINFKNITEEDINWARSVLKKREQGEIQNED